MKSLVIGHPYEPGRASYPTTEQVRLGPRSCEIVRFLPEPTAVEVRDFTTGTAQFALVEVSADLMVLAHQYGQGPWSDMPFQAHRRSPEQRGVPRLNDDGELFVEGVLVDATSGVVAAMRLISWPAPFSAAVCETVQRQLLAPFVDQAAAAQLSALYERYPSPVDMLRAGVDAACIVA